MCPFSLDKERSPKHRLSRERVFAEVSDIADNPKLWRDTLPSAR